jgi:hypothetical protein
MQTGKQSRRKPMDSFGLSTYDRLICNQMVLGSSANRLSALPIFGPIGPLLTDRIRAILATFFPKLSPTGTADSSKP